MFGAWDRKRLIEIEIKLDEIKETLGAIYRGMPSTEFEQRARVADQTVVDMAGRRHRPQMLHSDLDENE